MNSAATAPSRVRPRRRVFFCRGTGRGRPAVRRHVGRRRTLRGKSFRPCAVSGGLRRGERSRAGQILLLVRRVGRPSPWGVFSRGANPFARAPCREAFAEESVLARGKSFRSCAVLGGLRRGERSCAGQILLLVRRVGRPSPRSVFLSGANLFARAPCRVRPRRRGVFPAVRRSGAARRSSARGANTNPAGQILSLVRRVGRPSPWGVFLRGANPFARAPCREAFAEGRVLARGKSFRSCAVSGGLRRGERSRAGQILSPVRRVGRPSPRGVFSRGQILSLVRRVGRPSPRRAFSRGANPAHHPAASESRGAPSEVHPAVRVDLRAGRVQRAASAGEAAPCRSPKSAPPAAAAPLPRRHPPRRGHGRGAPHTARTCSTARRGRRVPRPAHGRPHGARVATVPRDALSYRAGGSTPSRRPTANRRPLCHSAPHATDKGRPSPRPH